MKAIWKDKILAESDETISIEGNHYFPPGSIKTDHLKKSDSHELPMERGSQLLSHRGTWRGQQ